MPSLLKTGMKYGALYGVAHEAGKVIGNSKDKKTNDQQPTVPTQQQQQQTQPPFQQQQYPQQQHQQRALEPAPGPATRAGYIHQSWCNGQCALKCNGGGNVDEQGYLHQMWCNGGCERKCNGSGSGQPSQQGEAASYYQERDVAGERKEK